MRVLKKCPKTTNFRQFPLSFCPKVTKKLQKTRKIINIRKPQCHHLNPLSQRHLTPLFSESPISPRVHSQPQNPYSSLKNRALIAVEGQISCPNPIFFAKTTVSHACPSTLTHPRRVVSSPQTAIISPRVFSAAKPTAFVCADLFPIINLDRFHRSIVRHPPLMRE